MSFVDIHTHVLPGVDDGAASVDEAVAMLRMAYEGGSRKIVATPHMFLDAFGSFDLTHIKSQFERFIEELKSLHEQHPFLAEVDLYLGAENYACPEFFEALEENRMLSLNGTRYLLVEVWPLLPFSQIENVIDRVFAASYTPILAHPERYQGVQEDPERMLPLWQKGCIVQVNADSLLGGWGAKAQKCARRLVGEGMVDVIASDGHEASRRAPVLDGVFRWLKDRCESEDVEQWFVQNPGEILVDEVLVPANHVDISK